MAMVSMDVPPDTHVGWRAAQTCGLVGLVALTLGLLLRPELAMTVLWFGLVPVLPAVLLVAPRLWRNVCPLATLETAASRMGRRKPPSAAWSRRAAGIGILMFAILLPARAVLFDHSTAAVLGAALVAVVLATSAGFVLQWKSGFCNAFCPMLPVERLYGQAPMVEVGNGRCGACIRCTPGACFDLTPRKSIAQLLGTARKTDDWLRTPFGMFVTSFPGLVVGYALVTGTQAVVADPDLGWARLANAYAVVALSAVVSSMAFRWWIRTRRLTWGTVTRTSAALSATAFYGFGAGTWASAWGLGPAAAWSARLLAWALVGVWLMRLRQQAAPLDIGV